MNNIIETPKIGISGKVLQWEVINADGSVDQSCYRPSDNLITDSGLVNFASMPPDPNLHPGYYFCIGTGTTEPATTDTRLTNETYRATCAYASYNSLTTSGVGSDPYYIYYQRGVQTPLGALNGTYGEIGFAIWQHSTINSGIICKHRLKDENGDPTTITVSSTQQLRLKYVLVFCLSPSTITTGTVNITGIGNINYQAKWQDAVHEVSIKVLFTGYGAPGSTAKLYTTLSDKSFLDIGAGYSYSGWTVNSSNSTSYTNLSRTSYGNWNVDTSNGTIYGIALVGQYNGDVMFFVKFDTPITKANTHSLSFAIKVSWGRA
jgi:hypothetical protein